jgi:hypothetical protein
MVLNVKGFPEDLHRKAKAEAPGYFLERVHYKGNDRISDKEKGR